MSFGIEAETFGNCRGSVSKIVQSGNTKSQIEDDVLARLLDPCPLKALTTSTLSSASNPALETV